ncbi:MAG: hypothetical protein COT89_00575 [Candidatus Colwellbacteria bacterium CG10_big_fil_rev_8_21_14_0_10_42_22]|uniref:Uncharacterized protein n=1 Tax=Candidatus Colwellbacteria bacterium CG10_big_fil_rev_8_21_14_0_10_42_22 TaxID=1974540 RepID=A0A2H0VGH8_9BACT|nr:MAG: hypothetical protein COT89_00575 [Candidatus Colwellbacteria bacterium CG10_big_fil_rev_8_21_14_0_10_42_22]
MTSYKNKGQSLLEILIAISISAIIIGSAVTAVMIALRTSKDTSESQKAYAIAQDILENVRSYAEGNWATFYATTTSSETYYLAEDVITATSTTLSLNTGTTTVSLSENDITTTYTAWFTTDPVYRNTNNKITTNESYPNIVDPITLNITAHVSWPVGDDTKQIQLSQYISRIRSDTYIFTDWSGSDGQVGPITDPLDPDYFSADSIIATGTGAITFP